MKKHVLKKSMVLGSLMAFVITGSALAANVNVADGETKKDVPVIEVVTNESFTNAGTVVAESITVDGGLFNNSGTIETGVLDIYGSTDDKSVIAGVIKADTFTYHGINGNLSGRVVTAQITANELQIIGKEHQTGFKVSDSNVLKNVKNITIKSDGGRTGLVIASGSSVDITKTTINLVHQSDAHDARIEIEEGAQLNAGTIIASGKSNKVQVNNSATAGVDNVIVKDNSNFSLQTYSNKTNQTAEFTLNNITVGDGSSFAACVYDNNSSATIKGKLDIKMGSNSTVDFGAMSKKDWRGEKINVAAESMNVTVDDAANSHVYISSGSEIKDSAITVTGTSKNNTGNAVSDLSALANVVQRTTEGENPAGNKPEVSAVDGTTVKQEASSIFDGANAIVQKGTDGKAEIKDVKIDANTNVYGILDTTTNALMTWRQENNDMNKRLGELRDSNGQHGVWVRMVRGQADYNSIDNQYNTYQLGYDEKLSTNPEWTVGAAVSYTDGSSDFASGSGENTHKSIAFYGSKLSEDGSFVDLIAKYGRLEHEFNVAEDTLSGEYATNGYSVSAEYGKRFEKENGFWIEPQVELTYGRVTEADYVNKQGNKVVQEDMDSLVGRLGFRLGRDIKQGNVYVRASYLYDFDGETAVSFTDSKGHKRVMEADLGGGWFEVGVGTNYNLSDATYLYFDVEKTYGGDVATPWQWNAGVRYSF